jgi:hypothetical protein
MDYKIGIILQSLYYSCAFLGVHSIGGPLRLYPDMGFGDNSFFC